LSSKTSPTVSPRIELIGYSLPTVLSRVFSVGLLLFAIQFVVRMAIGTGNRIARRIPIYSENFNNVIAQVPDQVWSALLGETATDVDTIAAQLFELFTTYFTDYVSSIASDIVNIFAQGFVVLFYIIFLMSEQSNFRQKIGKMFPNTQQRQEVQNIIASIADQSQKYISVKTYVSLVTGVGSFLIMALFGIEFAPFWAILIFILNYIPYVGSIIAVVFPVILSLFQFGDVTSMIILLGLLTAVQVAVGYVVEPIIMGNSLDISPFVVLVSLSVFGAIWGITGMILSIPIVIILIIILGHFEGTRPFAILLTGNGDLNFDTHQLN